jgi:EAL domain-containing protein (putative c-di-GMP-specific phosphodiesterase class I)/GGDEF domain-containing protein
MTHDPEAFSWTIPPSVPMAFQPIFDTWRGKTVAFELLARPLPPFPPPAEALQEALEKDKLWEVDLLFFRSAIAAVRAYRHSEYDFFVNVTPNVFSDPLFYETAMKELEQDRRLSPGRFILEMTEQFSVKNYRAFQQQIAAFHAKGVRIALDDMGAGHSNLLTLVSASPHFIKLDRALIQGIDKHTYQQNLVRSLVEFVSSVESRFVAEGVETWEELESLLRLGVRYCQGYLLGRPQPEPMEVQALTSEKVNALVSSIKGPKHSVQDKIARLVQVPKTFQVGSTNGEALRQFWHQKDSGDHIILLEGTLPVGLITRDHFKQETSGPFGYSLMQHKLVDNIAKRHFLRVKESFGISEVGRMALQRKPEDTYDPVIVTSQDHHFRGTVTMKQLLQHTLNLEVQRAIHANPLTNLPGNRMIQSWIEQALQHPPFTLIYADLDHFKAFNDGYGFLKGDEMIQMTASILQRSLSLYEIQGNVGHIGGDDFVLVAQHAIPESAYRSICQQFDREKMSLFDDKDRQRGHFVARNRKGETEATPLTTLSLAVLTDQNLTPGIHIGQLMGTVTLLKKQLKKRSTTESAYLIDRRVQEPDAFF